MSLRLRGFPTDFLEHLPTFTPKTVTYGNVSDRMLAARSDLPSEFDHPPDRDRSADAEGSLDEEQLRKLGYIE